MRLPLPLIPSRLDVKGQLKFSVALLFADPTADHLPLGRARLRTLAELGRPVDTPGGLLLLH